MRCPICKCETPRKYIVDGVCEECFEHSITKEKDDSISYRFQKRINKKRSQGNDVIRAY